MDARTTSGNWMEMIAWADTNWIVVVALAVFLILMALRQIENRLADIFTLLSVQQAERDVEESMRKAEAEIAQL